ncbi:MAG: choice-of-anchor D domain-containing protein [Sulfuricella sp.]|nr:choice-of-anchor D domain-containing protein [Sulfuricella sp.]
MKQAVRWVGRLSGMLIGIGMAAIGIAQADVLVTQTLAGDPTESVGVRGEGRFAAGAAYLSFSGAKDVGQVAIGSSKTLQLTVTNTGTATESISSITNSNTNFTMTQTCLTAGTIGLLAPGASCLINLVFKPQTVGSQTTDIGVNGDGSGLYYVLHVTGSGVAAGPSLIFSSASVDFGGVTVNTQSASQTVTVKNSGSAAIHITKAIGISGDFDGSTSCTSGGTGTLNPGASCNLTVTFKPTATGTRSGTLTLTSDDAYSPTYTVSLTGSGVAASGQSCSSATLNGGASVSGSASNPIINVNIVPACNDQGKTGSVFIAAFVPQLGLYFLDSSRTWKPLTGGCESIPAYSTGSLGALSQVTVFDGKFNFSGFQGTDIYVGYGVGGALSSTGMACNNMLNLGLYKKVHSVSSGASTPTPTPASTSFDSRLAGTWNLYHITADYVCYYYCNYVTRTVQFSTVTIQSDGSIAFGAGSGFDNAKLTPYAGSSDKWGEIGGLGGTKYYLYYDAAQDHPLQMRKIGGNDWDNVEGMKK